ncbi:hypothetical protein IFM89_034323 [Coptis chinensis]|uniref:Tubulin-specific chaperone D n=1 Tax=Coptis chinensis TaxID=261450 RepID=A0A835IIQ1_9MAGN|nr:hypothetical protein IFM89_034323 [Coptis chinensis]
MASAVELELEQEQTTTTENAETRKEILPIEDDDDEHDSKERVLQKYFLKEWKLVKSLLDNIVSNTRLLDLTSVYTIRSILDKYQFQGQLLEPYLETIISPLMFIVRSKTMELGFVSDEILEIIKPLCIIIYSLVTVCGYKAVIKFFPHQVSDLEPAVSLLEKCHHATAATALRQESTGEMEAKCVVLLWLYILVLVPFDISSVDTSVVGDKYLGGLETSPLVLKILGLCKDYLSDAGPMRGIAGLLLSRLLTRPDMPKAFTSFIEWTNEVLSSATDDFVDRFRLLGIVEALAAIFKSGTRTVLIDLVPIIWSNTSALMKSNTAARNPLLRKFLVKLTQRIGLTCLPPRLPMWRYVGSNSSLRENVLVSIVDKDNQSNHDLSGEEEMDVPEILEEIIEVLLSGLRDTDTVVRWSAAKGIGRITARLTSALADEVLSSVLELFSAGEGDGSWHGGCLALAELARRGLLLPVSLPKVVPVIVKALHYDVRRGPHSVGSHVRDAAAYVCWAFGRAYYHSDMKSILEHLAPHLLIVACYDREVNCRRAAAAAFQENVGRQGSFPNGIDIVNSADYFSLSSRMNSYLHVAVCIAQYKQYVHPFAEELLHSKICHWDKGLRELAVEALSALVKYDPGYFADFVLEKLIPCTLSTDLCMRHGATLAAGELVLALHKCDHTLSTDKQKSVAGIVPAIEKARLYRGKGGEIMRAAVSRFIDCISITHLLLPEKSKRSLLDTLVENLKHPNAQIQSCAVEAIKHFVPAYLVSIDDGNTNDIASKYLKLLDDPNVSARRGSALAIGVLPYDVLANRWRILLLKLCSCAIEDNIADKDAEARVNAIKGLVSVCETLTKSRKFYTFGSVEEDKSLYLLLKNEVMQTLFKALTDYSVDNRGDVGSWVREAAMDGLERCTYILCERQSIGFPRNSVGGDCVLELTDHGFGNSDQRNSLFDEGVATSLVGGISEKQAGKARRNCCKCPLFFSFPRFIQVLQFSCYSKHVLSGLVISVGGLQESLRKASITALMEYLKVTETEEHARRSSKEYMLSTDLLWVLGHYKRCDRVIIPTLKTIEILFSKQVLLSTEIHSSHFCATVLDTLAVELKGSKDFSKLYTGISILGYIASVLNQINSLAFSQLISFLGHRYPKIRKASADQSYLVLLQNENVISGDKIDKALEIISETCWEGDIEEAKHQRSQLYDLVGLEVGTILKTTNKESIKDAIRKATADENASYSSLVDSSGF